MNRRQAASIPFSVIPQDEAIRKIGKGAVHIKKRRGEIHFPRLEMCTKESGAHSEHRFLLGCTHTVQHFKVATSSTGSISAERWVSNPGDSLLIPQF